MRACAREYPASNFDLLARSPTATQQTTESATSFAAATVTVRSRFATDRAPVDSHGASLVHPYDSVSVHVHLRRLVRPPVPFAGRGQFRSVYFPSPLISQNPVLPPS